MTGWKAFGGVGLLCPGTLGRSPSWWRVEVLRRFGFVLNDCQLTGVSCAAPPPARPSTGCVAGAKSSQSPTVSRAASHPSYLSLQRTQNDWILGQEDLEGNVWSFITRVLAGFDIINMKDVSSLNTSLKTERVLGGDCEVSQTDYYSPESAAAVVKHQLRRLWTLYCKQPTATGRHIA